MVYPLPVWKGKPVVLSRHAPEKVLYGNVPVRKVLEVLETGVTAKEKREEGVFELVKGFKDEMLKVVVADAGERWVVVTVLRFSR